MQTLFNQLDQLTVNQIWPFTVIAFVLLIRSLYLWQCREDQKEMDIEIKEINKRNEGIKFAESLLSKIFKKEILIIFVSLFLFSCSQTARMNHYQKINGLSHSGTYTIKTLRGDTATFEGVAYEYTGISDTAKVGDQITITFLKRVK